jgi:hypothetical protein
MLYDTVSASSSYVALGTDSHRTLPETHGEDGEVISDGQGGTDSAAPPSTPGGYQLADGADRVARRMGREQSRDYSPGKRRSEGRSSRLSSLNMKMCTLTPTPVE